MGFLSLISADSIGASYDPRKGVLILVAEGCAPKGTTGIRFYRDTFLGGLKFELQGWVLRTNEKEHYSVKNEIKIHLPSRALPSNNVITVTADCLEGKVIPIHWLGFGGKASNANTATTIAATTAPATNSGKVEANSPIHVLPDTRIITAFGVEFTISARAKVPTFGEVKIVYDDKYLKLITASIEDEDIVWKFDPIRIGDTVARVDTYGGIASYITQKTYDIEILPLLHTPGGDGSEPDATLSFLGNVNIAQNIVRRLYPDAWLWTVDASLPNGVHKPTDDPRELSSLKAAFGAKANGKQITIYMNSTSWGEWAPPFVVQRPLIGNGKIDSLEELIDIADSVKRLRDMGYHGKFWSADLRQPLGPGAGDNQPYYVFRMESGEQVYVPATKSPKNAAA